MPGPAADPPVTQKREFWVLMGYAAALGVFGAFAGLVFLGIIKFGSRWSSDSSPGLVRWALVVGGGYCGGRHRGWPAAAGDPPARRCSRPVRRPASRAVDPRLVLGTVAVSAVSLIGGASVGPEKVLATIGGGAGSWVAQRRGLGKEDARVNTLAGIAGIFGGLFSSPVIVVMLILEVARPGGHRFSKTLVTDIVAASVSFGIYFAIAGAVFLGAYRVPRYTFEDWQLLAGIPLGLFGALVTTLTAGFMVLASRLFGRLKVPADREINAGRHHVRHRWRGTPANDVLRRRPAHFRAEGCKRSRARPVHCDPDRQDAHLRGQPGQWLPGRPHLPDAVHRRNRRGRRPSGHPGVPLGLAFSCLLTTVLGSLAAPPFAMVLMAAFLTRVGPLQTFPIFISVVTAFSAGKP